MKATSLAKRAGARDRGDPGRVDAITVTHPEATAHEILEAAAVYAGV